MLWPAARGRSKHAVDLSTPACLAGLRPSQGMAPINHSTIRPFIQV
jgi:hypothetical protein